jgi:phosphatidylserine/phosphatidylglycerophosphate/cardiolipin synthase-like enzyme
MATQVFLFLPKPADASVLREAYPYGPPLAKPAASPPPVPGFHTDVGIEIHPDHILENRARAVVPGLVRLIPDPSTPQICTLVLIPYHHVLRDLRAILGGGSVVFIYRNIVTPPPPAADPALWPKAPLDGYTAQVVQLGVKPESVPDRTQQMNQFLAGKTGIEAKSGELLLLPSTQSGRDGWARLGFEIAFVPNGLNEDWGWKRLQEIVAPQNKRTRRLDVMSFYQAVAAGDGGATLGGGATLAADQAGHPLLTLCSRRALLEVRDEWDDPAEGFVEISVAGGAADLIALDPAVRSTVEINVGTAASVVEITRPNYSLTDLPSGAAAVERGSRSLTAPSHWAVQALFVADIDSPEGWFVTNTPPLPRFTPGNRVTPIRDGVEVFQRYADTIRSLTNSSHYLYIAGWILMDGFPLLEEDFAKSSMLQLLTAAAVQQVQIRVLLWKQSIDLKHPLDPPANRDEAQRINDLAQWGKPGLEAQAILDDRTHECTGIQTGTHHQKFLVAYGEAGKEVAYCGGVDLNQNRRDSPNHGAAAGYHDVHAMVEGPAVADIHFTFADRWNSHPERRSPVPDQTSNYEKNAGSVYVQVARTYPRPRATPLSFSPNGSFTPLQALIRAIRKAKKFIYIEDQYLTPYAGTDAAGVKDATQTLADDPLYVLDELRKALAQIDFLIAVIPNHVQMGWLLKIANDAGQSRYRRMQFIDGLRAVDDPNNPKVYVYYLQRSRREQGYGEDATAEGDGPLTSGSPAYPNEIYCHSKVWMVDDVCFKIGSANCNRRSYTHDGEIDIVMVDGALANGGRALARNFRRQLWGEHLGIPYPHDALLEDHLTALDFWRLPERRQPGARISEYLQDDLEGKSSWSTTGWDGLVDPDGS